MRIENGLVAVSYSEDAGLTAECISDGRMQVVAGTLYRHGGTAGIIAVSDKLWGKGKAIEVRHEDGSASRACVFSGIPFVFITTTVTNPTSQSLTLHSVEYIKLTLSLGAEPGELRALGTGGLTGLARGNDKKHNQNPGSFSHLAIAEPNDRRGLVCGWLSQERGSGIVFSDVVDGRGEITGQLDFGRLEVKPGASEELDTFVFGFFADARAGLEQLADLIAKRNRIVLKPQPGVYCTWYHAGASNETAFEKNTHFAAEHLKDYGLSVMQVDDGWQDGQSKNGPRKNFTKVKADGPYKSGMRNTSDMVKKARLVPGIWYMPFAGTWDDPYFADKQEWFAKGPDGKPFDTKWGGTCLDLTRPDVREYVTGIARTICRDWGYEYIKIDGLWTGTATRLCYVQSGYSDDAMGESRLADANMTHIQAYRAGLRAVREGAGQGVFILGCCIAQNMRSMGASYGLVDAMRIGPDNGRKWHDMLRGPWSGSNLYFLHGRVWYNDPDPLYVGKDIPAEQARTLLTWVAISGQLNSSSENYADLPADRLDMLRRSIPAHGRFARPVDIFENTIPKLWLLSDGSRAVIGCFNWDEEKEVEMEYPLEKVGLSGKTTYVGFDYWADRFVGPFSGSLKVKLSPAGCMSLSVRAMSDEPQALGTSRHVTQGITDILDERWNRADRTLSGSSLVVGGDDYEIRIYAAKGAKNWPAAGVSVSGEDTAAGVIAKVVGQDGPCLRVRITSPVSRCVKWRVAFE
jgi:hypothetical protein